MMENSDRVAVTCPICAGIVELDPPQPGTLVDCPDCGETFRIASQAPLRLVYAFDSDEEPISPEDDHPRAGGLGAGQRSVS